MKAQRRRWFSRVWLALFAATVLLVVVTVGVRWAGHLLVVSLPPRRGPDAIVSLASHEWERLPAVATLAREYPSAVVLLTLPLRVTEQNCHRCSERRGLLIKAGVEADRVHILTDRVSNTRDEAAACLAYATRAKPSEIIIVTSPYHTRRALATFRRVFDGTEVKLAVHPALGTSPARPLQWWRQPYDRAYVAYEWAAIAYYAIRFGVYPWGA